MRKKFKRLAPNKWQIIEYLKKLISEEFFVEEYNTLS